MDTQNTSDNSERVLPALVVNGTVKEGTCSPPIGLFETGESTKAYIFSVMLPGVAVNNNNFRCNINRSGRVTITGEVPSSTDGASRMIVQQHNPPGPFSVSFNLPGPVDPRLVSVTYRSGLLEVQVAKYQRPIMPMPVGVVFPNYQGRV